MKKLLNDPNDLVAESLRGVDRAHPELRIDHENRILYRADAPVAGKVGLLSGGGSGHEPAHAGFIGPGMLDAVCAGEVFTSPVPDQMAEATKNIDGGAGVLHLVWNYTGDVMNFDMAAELAAAETDTRVEAVVINDDVAVEDSLFTAGRRGTGAAIPVEKMVGAAAEQGRGLTELADLARRVNDSTRSMGMALTSCTVPAKGSPTFDLPDDEIEIGIGIHGEPGRRRVPLAPAREIARMLVEPVLADLDFTGGDGVLVFVNGLGATPLLELHLMYGEIAALLDSAGVVPVRTLVGPYVTSLDMAGCSVTLTRLDDELLRLWDAPVATLGLRWGDVMADLDVLDVDALQRWLRVFAASVAEQRDALTALDAAIGDADHGANMHRGMTAVVGALDALDTAPATDPAALLKQTGMVLIRSVGGASGPLYGTLFLRMASATGGEATVGPETFAKALRAGAEGVVGRGKAELGDKTMIDALAPALDALDAALGRGEALPAALRAASAAADAGRDATTPMTARKGRASYLGERSAGHQDPGATSAALLVAAAATALAEPGPT